MSALNFNGWDCRFGRGEGVVAIVLKPLEAAVRDHDHIYATVRSGDDAFHHAANVLQILGTGVNSSGSIAPVSAPVASAQRDAMRRAFSQTDRKPQDVDFLELHATGRIGLQVNSAQQFTLHILRDCFRRSHGS